MKAINASNFLKHEVDIIPEFELQNWKHDRNNKIQSAILTFAFYSVLFLIFYLVIFLKPPFPPLSGEGVYLNIGLVEEGMGDVQPMGTADQFQYPQPEASSASGAVQSNDVVTQDIEKDVPVIPKKEEPKKNSTVKDPNKNTNKTTNTQTQNQPPKPKALYPGTTTNNSSSEGTGNTTGDQGKPNGNPFGDAYSGNPGEGNNPNGPGGNGLGMSGRHFVYYHKLENNSQKTGKVVVNIQADKAGNIISAKATQKGSTTTDTYLWNLAQEMAIHSKVNANPDGAEVQYGTITYNFINK